VKSRKTRVGIVGCGNIFERYVTGLRHFDELEIAWCADIDVALAKHRAAELDLPIGGSPDDAIAGHLGEAALALNLTPPNAHAQVTTDLLRAGFHVYTEKPLATTVDDASELLEVAREAERLLGAAPDWFLGPTGRAASAAVRSGAIGEPIAVTGFITHSQVETWHPNPAIFFQPGGGPVFDLGPYYVSVLAVLLGPIRSVAALMRTGAPTRAVTTADRVVDVVPVDVPTHAVAVLEHASGVVGNLTMSFEVWERTMPFIEVYGTEGTLSVPMPHESDGPLRLKLHGEDDWRDVAPAAGEAYVRGIGVAQMAEALRSGAPPAASGELGFHVLEVLTAIERSSTERSFVAVGKREER